MEHHQERGGFQLDGSRVPEQRLERRPPRWGEPALESSGVLRSQAPGPLATLDDHRQLVGILGPARSLDGPHTSLEPGWGIRLSESQPSRRRGWRRFATRPPPDLDPDTVHLPHQRLGSTTHPLPLQGQAELGGDLLPFLLPAGQPRPGPIHAGAGDDRGGDQRSGSQSPTRPSMGIDPLSRANSTSRARPEAISRGPGGPPADRRPLRGGGRHPDRVRC
jgi:hypothetical protein